MNATASVLLALATFPGLSAAQIAPPPRMAQAETERTRACVGALARVAEFAARMEPFAARAERLRALDGAIALEDSTYVMAADALSPLDEAVLQWLRDDAALARRIVAGEGGLEARRTAEREAVRARVGAAVDSLQADVTGPLAEGEQIEMAAAPCEGVVFVRPAVLEACTAEPSSPLCEAARAPIGESAFSFVDAAADLWDIEEVRPWTDPARLAPGPQGGIVGARAVASARAGNISLMVALSPILRDRSVLSEDQIREFETNLDSLGFTYEHPNLVMAPGLEVQLLVAGPMGEETHYVLHFGDAIAEESVIWSTERGEGFGFRTVLPAPGPVLARLQAGETLTLTAIREAEGSPGEAVFSLSLTTVNQERALGSLVLYMSDGGLGRDLATLVPPPEP